MRAVAPTALWLTVFALAISLAACASSSRDERPGAAILNEAGSPATPAPESEIQPEKLLGLSAERLTALLGPADFVRNDGPAEIWQFRNGQCILDVFLYRQQPGDGYRVEHVESRDGTRAGVADPACVSELLRTRRALLPAS